MEGPKRGRVCLIALPAALLAAFLTTLGAMPAAAGSIYSVFYDDRFGTIDSTTGAYTQIGTLPISAASGVGVFNDTLFAQSMQGELVSINPASGAATVIGNAGLSTTSEAFAATDNGLFEIDSLSNLYSINPSTGAGMLVGSLGLPANNGGWDTSLSPDGSNLFFTAGSGGAIDELYEINTTTGKATNLGSTGVSGIAGSAIVGSYLDLFQYNAGTDHIYTAPVGSTSFAAGPVLSVQIVDGGATFGQSGGFSQQAPSSVPEPAAFLLVLLGLGLIGLGLARRRGKAEKTESRR